MTIGIRSRITWRAVAGLAALASVVACGPGRTTAPRAPTLIIQGSWDYTAVQPVGSGGAFRGLLDISTLEGDAFSGGFSGGAEDSTGSLIPVTALVTGERTDSTSVHFLFVTPQADTVINDGTQTGDTLTGQWTNRRAIQIGSFSMIRRGTDKQDGELTKSVRPRRP